MKDKISEILAKYYYVDWRDIDECIRTIKEELSKVCVSKEDLPDEEGWFEICYAVIRMSEFCEDWDGFTEQKALDLASSLAKQIAKRMGEEVIQ